MGESDELLNGVALWQLLIMLIVGLIIKVYLFGVRLNHSVAVVPPVFVSTFFDNCV